MPLSTSKKVAAGLASAAVTGLLVVGGATLANAAGETTPTAPGSSSSAQAGDHAPHEHTAVTGDEASTVSAAVTAKDSTVTVSEVQKDPDGSYDVNGTKAGAEVHFDVSADLATVTERTGRGGPDGGRGAGGGAADTPVTGDEASGVSAAVTAKDSSVTVSEVRKDPDGSYDVDGTRAGAQVHFDVSADLATVTERTGGRAGDEGGGPGDGRGAGRDRGSDSSSGSSSNGSDASAQQSGYATATA